MGSYFHVTSIKNRDSIAKYGLDWKRMGAAMGIAGSLDPELAGCFLCRPDEGDVEFFLQINNTGGPVDVWRIEGVNSNELRDMDGFVYIERTIPPRFVSLESRDVEPDESMGW